LQFAKASAATLSQQEKNNSADLQPGRVNIYGLSVQWQDNPRGDVISTSFVDGRSHSAGAPALTHAAA
jgi:hypothetical protein